jgi:hypothetical protein
MDCRRVFPFLILTLTAGAWTLLAQSDGMPSVRTESAPAGTVPSPAQPWWANRGHWNFGGQLSFVIENPIPHDITHIKLLMAEPQVGFVVKDFDVRHFPLRRFEVLGEGVFGNAVHPGGRITGGALLLRFEGLSRGRFLPFAEAGGGVQNTTLASRARELDGDVQFTPQGGIGLQYFFRPQRALVFEYSFIHMSNADLQMPNLGWNGSMLTVGFRWLRRPAPGASPGEALKH